jgi:hypothetical protein
MEIWKVSDGENILKLFKQMRQLCEQISLLLRTADEQMTKADWENQGNLALSDTSANILNPAQWIPIVMFRFYKHKDYPNRLACVSVLLDDHWEREYTLTEPVVTAGFFDYGKTSVNNDWEYWYARYFGHLIKARGLKPDGQPFHFDKMMLSPDKQGKFEGGEIFALPLVSITNSNDVESQITSKLLNLLKGGK